MSTLTTSPGNSLPTSANVSLTIAEQIRQFLSSNIIKPNCSTTDTISTSLSSKPSLDKLSDIVKVENGNLPLINSLVNDTTNEYVQQRQSPFAFPKNETVPVVIPPFNYPSSISTPNSVNSFPTSNFPSFNSLNPSMTLNSASKLSTSAPVPNFVSQPSQYFYPISTTTVYPSPLNSTVSDATAAILQAYSQFNVQPSTTTTTTPSTTMVHQQLTAQQHPIRK